MPELKGLLGVALNTFTVILGSFIGMIFKKKISKNITDAVMVGIGLCTLYIGISGALSGNDTLILIISMVAGAVIGTLLNIDAKINSLGNTLQQKFSKGDENTIAQGFVTGSLLFCVGSMTIVGSLQSGISGDNTMIYTKSILDLISSMMLAASLGIGVMFSSAFVFVFQGILVVGAGFLSNVFTQMAIDEITCAGSVMIIALGLNIIGITKIKVANYLPALIVVPILCFLWVKLGLA